MKTCLLFVCVVAFLWVEASADCPPLDNPQGDNTVLDGTVISSSEDCSQYTCKNGVYNHLPCAESRCKDQIGVTATDYSLPYPDCCPKAICP